MAEALNYIYQIYNAFLDLVFNRFQLFSGVTIGWVLVSVVVFSLMITNILNLPRLSRPVNIGGRNKNG